MRASNYSLPHIASHMRKTMPFAGIVLLGLLAAPLPSALADVAGGDETALDRYVHSPDSAYTYKLLGSQKGAGGSVYYVELTSQRYLTTAEVDRPLWTHQISVVIPDEVKHSTALLFIGGGANDGKPPRGPDEGLIRAAIGVKSVVAELRHVPNQPLVFAGETKGRTEDSLIAYTWDKFLRTGDEKWPARLPMTKSAVRAMDAISAFCASQAGGGVKVDKFVVAGGSKRGWTTWTTAAVDKRVVAIVPIVIDMLNVEPSFEHHFAAYGFWAPAVGDYAGQGIMNWRHSKEYAALMKIEEPFQYRDRLTLPKLILNSAGDQFFLPDSSQFYFNDLKGPKYLRYVPNSDHSLKNTDALETLTAFYSMVLSGQKMPELDWSFPEPGVIKVKSTIPPSEVKLWAANNPEARDFRLDTLGPKYQSATLTPAADGSYVGRVQAPEKGWTAHLVEFTFKTGPLPLKLTTPVKVIPDILPFKDKIPPGTEGTR